MFGRYEKTHESTRYYMIFLDGKKGKILAMNGTCGLAPSSFLEISTIEDAKLILGENPRSGYEKISLGEKASEFFLEFCLLYENEMEDMIKKIKNNQLTKSYSEVAIKVLRLEDGFEMERQSENYFKILETF